MDTRSHYSAAVSRLPHLTQWPLTGSIIRPFSKRMRKHEIHLGLYKNILFSSATMKQHSPSQGKIALFSLAPEKTNGSFASVNSTSFLVDCEEMPHRKKTRQGRKRRNLFGPESPLGLLSPPRFCHSALRVLTCCSVHLNGPSGF